MKRLAPRRAPQGAAMLIALLVVALMASTAATLMWLQWRAARVELAERARSQASWILVGALDWARLILREDKRSGGPDHLGEPWAVPLAEARLSTFLAADRDNTDQGPDVFLSGSISDLQAFYNLSNVVEQGKVKPEELKVLRRLMETVGLSPGLADTLASGMAAAARAADDPGVGLRPSRVEQLRWLGAPAPALPALARVLTVLPRATPVNLNTAPREVISACIEGLDLGSAERLVQYRKRQPLKALEDLNTALGRKLETDPQRVGVSSEFFEVRGRLRSPDMVVEERSVVERRGADVVTLSRQTLVPRLESRNVP
jgi:general secretion pathway protein K